MRSISQLMLCGLLLSLLSVLHTSPPSAHSQAGANCQTFPQTQHTVCRVFLAYWQSHGGLAQQGYPLTEEFTAVSDLDSKSYTMQVFERAVLEKHPENPPPYDVLLSQLGALRYKQKYPGGAPNQVPAPDGSWFG